LADFPPWRGLFDLFDTPALAGIFFIGEAIFHLLKVCDDTHPKHWHFNDNRLAGYTFLAWHSLAIARFFTATWDIRLYKISALDTRFYDTGYACLLMLNVS
jgi:hypothetical protein